MSFRDPSKDHFSGHAADYSRFRPTYPPELFAWLAGRVPADDLVWDCATGNGQAARALAAHFERVFATDASAEQVQAATPHPRVEFGVRPASDSGLDDASVGLLTVAQALHWFDFDAFFAEAQRVVKPGGFVVAWCYELFSITAEVDAPMLHLYRDIVGSDWPAERRHIETGYASVPWPWPTIETPPFEMRAAWTVEQTLGYLRTWSASRRYLKREGTDPVAQIESDLREAWGDAPTREATWPVKLLASRIR